MVTFARLPFLGFSIACLATLLPVDAQSLPKLWIASALSVPLVWLSVVDLDRNEIPDAASLAVAVIGLASWWGQPDLLLVDAVVALFVVLALGLGTELIWRDTGRDVLGLGDIKLIGAGILVVGAPSAWMMIMLASVGGILAGLLSRRRHEAEIPFGPFLASAIFITFLVFGTRT